MNTPSPNIDKPGVYHLISLKSGEMNILRINVKKLGLSCAKIRTSLVKLCLIELKVSLIDRFDQLANFQNLLISQVKLTQIGKLKLLWLGHLPFWSSSILVIFHSLSLLFWSSSSLILSQSADDSRMLMSDDQSPSKPKQTGEDDLTRAIQFCQFELVWKFAN